jgi:formate hydrogenlyase subunit 3/multisubunit Na+/H+ antiporter MnhD subunit
LAAFAVLAAVTVPPVRRAFVGGATCALLSAAGLFTGAVAMAGQTGSLEIPMALPLDPVTLAPDRLGGLFILVASAVGVLVSVYGIGYVSGPSASRTSWAAMATFLVGMQLVPAAADVVSFLLAWEVMALASTALLLADHARRPQVRSAALWYAVMTHLSFLLLLAGFAVLAAASGGTEFADLATVGSRSGVAGLAFVLLILGFGCKAGLVPLHVWLPRAHPEAPSHVSAAMSAAMVKMGVYGALLMCVRLQPAGPTWWGVLLAALGAASAMYGILQASVASDVKRLLAYSTTENVGLMILALGVSVLLRAHGVVAGADAALTACLLLVVSHAAFKATLFLGAGSVQHATEERDLDRLGGLGTRMPWTAAAFGVASLGAAALPVTVGFVAEWTLLQSLVHGARPQDPLVAVVMPAGVAVVALTAGLALLTFVKAYGIGFLARPRSERAAGAHEAPVSMRVAMAAGAGGVVLLGLLPGPLASRLAATVGARGVKSAGLAGLDLSGINALLDPVALTALAAAVAVPVGVIAVVAARAHPRRTSELVWGCGGARVSPRMQYTATSYAEPLMRVFDDALQPARDVEVTHAVESRYLVQRVQYRQRVADVIETGMYRPVLTLAGRVGVGARRLQNGRIHRYLAFSFFALLAVVLVASL